MPAARRIERELSDLRKEVAGLRADYDHLKGRAAASVSEGAARYGAIRRGLGNMMGTMTSDIGERAGTAVDDISERLDDLRERVNDYSVRAEKTVVAHPFAAVAGAVAVGYLIARLNR